MQPWVYPTFVFESWAPFREKLEGEAIENVVKLREDLFEYIRSLEYKIIPIRGWNEIFWQKEINSNLLYFVIIIDSIILHP